MVSLSIGLGSGTVYVLVTFVPILWESMGPGALFTDSCPRVSLFMISGTSQTNIFSLMMLAALALAFLLLHIILSVAAFEAYRLRKWHYAIAVWVVHYAASFLVGSF